MTKRFESSMRGETFSEKDLVEGYFAYIMAVKACEEVIRDYPDEGIPLVVSLVESCISLFSDLIVNNKESGLDTQVKAVELKNFIFQNLIEECIVILAKNGGMKEIINVEECNQAPGRRPKRREGQGHRRPPLHDLSRQTENRQLETPSPRRPEQQG